MQDHPVLAHVTIGHAPVMDVRRAIVGARLGIAPARSDASVDGRALLAALSEVWQPPPLHAGKATPGGMVSLNLVGEPLFRAVLAAKPAAPFAIEVPRFLLGDSASAAALRAASDAGVNLWLKGRGESTATEAMPGKFGHALFDHDEPPPAAGLQAVASGVQTSADIEVAFKRGAVAVTGWPLHDELPKSGQRPRVAPEMHVVLELMQRIDREESIDRLEATLKGDPSLAYRLLRYLNSAAFGLRVEITTFRHALQMLGYHKLKRWLSLLLMWASKDASLTPVMFAALRRGLLMEELGRGSGDAEMRSEMFICGVFSLLDRMLKQPFGELLSSVPMPERVGQALSSNAGPYMPYLELARAIESGSGHDIGEATAALMLGPAEVNRALLTSLLAARQLE